MSSQYLYNNGLGKHTKVTCRGFIPFGGAITFHKAALQPWVLPAFAITCLIAIAVIFHVRTKKTISNNPRWPLTPYLLGSHVLFPKGSLCPSPMKIHQCMWIQSCFFKTLAKKSVTSRRHLTLFLFRSHVRIYPICVPILFYIPQNNYALSHLW